MVFNGPSSPLTTPSSTASFSRPHSPRFYDNSSTSDEVGYAYVPPKTSHLSRRRIRRHILAALGLILLTIIIVSFSSHQTPSGQWSSAVEYARSFTDSKQPKGLPEDHHIVWATETQYTQEARFPSPNEQYRFNFLHALVRAVDETYKETNPALSTNHFVHILSLIDQTPLQKQTHPMWQTYQAANLTDVIQDILCVFSFGSAHAVTHAVHQNHREYPYPNIQMASLLYCPVPDRFKRIMDTTAEKSVSEDDMRSKPFFSFGRRKAKPKFVRLTLQFDFHNAEDAFYYNLKLYPQVVPKNPPQNEMAMCLAPMFNFDDEAADLSLQWREHHRLLGVNTVHWYGRSPDWASRIQHYNQLQGTKDTFRLANRISPETKGGTTLEVEGEYADQVLYMMDCMLRSLTSSPSAWLAFSDLDEFWVPNPTTPQGLASFLGSRDEFVGATCQARSHVSGEALSLTTDESVTHDEGMKKQRRPKAHSPSQLDLKLASFDHIREPLPFDGFDNHKCIYRPETVEMAIVHEPVSFFHPAIHPWRQDDDGDILLIHMGSHKAFGKGPWTDKFEPREDYIEHLQQLSRSRDGVKSKLSDPVPQDGEVDVHRLKGGSAMRH